jgi:hypothetical protein
MDLLSSVGGDDYFRELERELASCKSMRQLEHAIVNSPFSNRRATAMLGLGIVVFLLVNKKDRTIERIAVSDNDLAAGTFQMSAKPFKEIKIPLGFTRNFIAKAIKERHYMITSDWEYLFIPALTAEQARFNQAGGGISCSVVYPLSNIADGGAMIFSYYESIDRIKKDHHNFMTRYAAIVQRAFTEIERTKTR